MTMPSEDQPTTLADLQQWTTAYSDMEGSFWDELIGSFENAADGIWQVDAYDHFPKDDPRFQPDENGSMGHVKKSDIASFLAELALSGRWNELQELLSNTQATIDGEDSDEDDDSDEDEDEGGDEEE